MVEERKLPEIKGRPTPTQEELNKIAEHEEDVKLSDDGSGPDPNLKHADETKRKVVHPEHTGQARTTHRS